MVISQRHTNFTQKTKKKAQRTQKFLETNKIAINSPLNFATDCTNYTDFSPVFLNFIKLYPFKFNFEIDGQLN